MHTKRSPASEPTRQTSADDLRRAAELLPEGASLTIPREALLDALAASSNADTPVTPKVREADRWISADEVGQRLSVSRRYVYAHRRSFPFAKELPGGSIRFSEAGLLRWMQRV